ncbi:hypothetical protein FDECE_1218 [Fusarium decemcellulare]|nr:hypothetical protein FDECE_1218 [Fusarium decemcellulare]
MVSIQDIRQQLTSVSSHGPGLVAVFGAFNYLMIVSHDKANRQPLITTVGGTSGIGESTAREFVRYAASPRVYLVGRSREQANRIENEFQQLNPSSRVQFIQSDVSQLRNVDKLCEQIKVQEEKINFLFLTAGIFHMRGREETAEGLDRKMALDFYSRLRFTENLLPLLRRAAIPTRAESSPDGTPPLARVVSVLGGGNENPIDSSDLSLKDNYTLSASTKHAVVMNTLSFEHLSSVPENSGIAFFHTRPGMVKTNGDRELGSLFKLLVTVVNLFFKPWVTPLQECGERHLWALTSNAFKGGHLYLLGQRSELVENSKILNRMRDEGLSDEVWAHTTEVFQKICSDEHGKY